LAKAGLLDYEIVFGITSYLSKERSYIVWKTARAGFKYVETMLKRTEAFGVFRASTLSFSIVQFVNLSFIFQKYVSNLVKPVYQEIGRKPASDSDENLTIFLRSLVVAWSCDLGLKECTEESLAEVEKWMESADPAHKGANPVNKELRTSGYCTAVAEGDESHFNFVLERSFETNVQTEKSALLRALTCTKEIWLLNRLFFLPFSDAFK
jgi:aminopeptidase N